MWETECLHCGELCGSKRLKSEDGVQDKDLHQDVDPELGEVLDLDGYSREGVRDVKLGDELPKDQQPVLKDLVQRYRNVFTDMPRETDVIQHQIKLIDDTSIRCMP